MKKHMQIAVRVWLLLALCASFAFVFTPARASGNAMEVKVVASGLNNPRGMTVGPDGAVYVAEAGSGGDTCVEVGVDDTGQPVMSCFGFTGAITRIRGGKQMRIFKNLPSMSGGPEGTDILGVHDVAFTLRGLRVTLGLGNNPEVRALFPEKFKYFGYLGQLLWGRNINPLVDVSGYELANNPEPTAVDSNPYAVINDGSVGVVADAGGNSLLAVDKHGNITTLAVFPPKIVDVPPGLPFPLPPQMPMEAVPNSVVKGADGAYYVGELGGFPFVAGESDVLRVVPGQPVEVFQEGFTSIIDIAFDRHGNLYVLEMAVNGLLVAGMTGDWTGALIRVNVDGSREVVMQEGLWAPTGMTIDRHGNIYVANRGTFVGEGEVLKIRP